MKTGFIIAAAAAAVLQTGCWTAPARASKAADLAAIQAFNRQYLQAINSGDSSALSRLTSEDHVMLAPNRSPLTGKAANVAAMKKAFELFTIQESWTPLETKIAGDWAYQRGTYHVKATPKNGGASTTSTGNFLRIYQRQPDGSWSLTRDMFNSDQPPAAN